MKWKIRIKLQQLQYGECWRLLIITPTGGTLCSMPILGEREHAEIMAHRQAIQVEESLDLDYVPEIEVIV